MVNVIILPNAVLFSVVVVAQIYGHRGERLAIRCPYKSGYETNSKYLCKGECNFGNKNIMVESGSPAKDMRFSLTDNKTSRVFTVTITDLRTEDEGQYWCVVKRKYITDVYSEILLLVKQGPLTHQPLLLHTSSDSSAFVIIITAGGLVLLLICAAFLIVAVRKKKTCGLVSFSAEVLQVLGSSGEENAYETGNPAVISNSRTAQSHDGSSSNEFHRAATAEAVDTDFDYASAAAGVRTGVNPDQIYTELNTSRHSNIYQSLIADSQEVSVYYSIDQMME
ncbi:CMRF35-like molecule 1 isoform X3 [Labeo rohita]|uniref:CMRF35-like molecule 1 isoform X3 n=1 Tax=Labeo rohita TaxID=84645 RepID=UPI0021E1F394|nr:CMRF35-like molecule 1 isoform X3 [Labeo rohita]